MPDSSVKETEALKLLYDHISNTKANGTYTVSLCNVSEQVNTVGEISTIGNINTSIDVTDNLSDVIAKINSNTKGCGLLKNKKRYSLARSNSYTEFTASSLQ